MLTQDIATAKGDASVTRLLQKSLASGKQYLVRKLNVTVKSHKPAGQVAFRSFHGGVSVLSLGWVCGLLTTCRRRRVVFHTILRNARDLVKPLNHFQCQSRSPFAFVNIDIYFMFGTRDELQLHGSELLPYHHRLPGI